MTIPGGSEEAGRDLTIDVLGPFFKARGNRLVSITANGPGAILLEGLTWPVRVSPTHYRATAPFLTGAAYRGARTVEVTLKSGGRKIRLSISVRF